MPEGGMRRMQIGFAKKSAYMRRRTLIASMNIDVFMIQSTERNDAHTSAPTIRQTKKRNENIAGNTTAITQRHMNEHGRLLGNISVPTEEQERQRKWLQASPDKKRAKVHRRRSREQAAEGSFTDAEWAALKAYYNYTCLRCDKGEPEILLT